MANFITHFFAVLRQRRHVSHFLSIAVLIFAFLFVSSSQKVSYAQEEIIGGDEGFGIVEPPEIAEDIDSEFLFSPKASQSFNPDQPLEIKLMWPKARTQTDLLRQYGNTLYPPVNSSTGKITKIGTFGTVADRSWLGFRFSGLSTLQNYDLDTAKAEIEVVPNQNYAASTYLNITIYGENNVDPQGFTASTPIMASPLPSVVRSIITGTANTVNVVPPVSGQPVPVPTPLPAWTTNVPTTIDVTNAFRSALIIPGQDKVSILIKGNGTTVRQRSFWNEFQVVSGQRKGPRLKLTVRPKTGGAEQVKYIDLAEPTRYISSIANQHISTTKAVTWAPGPTATPASYWVGTKANVNESYLGLRFEPLPTPPTGYRLKTAKLKVQAYANSSLNFNADIFAEKVLSSQPFAYSTNATERARYMDASISARRRTTASSPANATLGIPTGNWVAKQFYEYDVTAPVLEVLNTRTQHAPLALIVKGKQAANLYRAFYSDTANETATTVTNRRYMPRLVVQFERSATASPTPTPTGNPGSTPQPPVCLNVTTSPSNPTYQSSAAYTCGLVTGATSYQFRYRVVDPTTNAIIAPETVISSSTTPNISQPVVQNHYGRYQVQCRPCNAVGCAQYEPW